MGLASTRSRELTLQRAGKQRGDLCRARKDGGTFAELGRLVPGAHDVVLRARRDRVSARPGRQVDEAAARAGLTAPMKVDDSAMPWKNLIAYTACERGWVSEAGVNE